MRDIAQEIRKIIEDASEKMVLMTAEEVSAKEAPDRWCRKEMLGHLIDSAANNHQRFVRACLDAAADFPPYSQNEWVRIQRYNESDWPVLVALWSAYNRHLSDIVERIPQEARSSPCNIGREEPVTLEFIVNDYLRHLRHHVTKILSREG